MKRAAACAAVILVFVMPQRPPAFSPDSTHYLYASQSLLDGRGWRNDLTFARWADTYTEWAPLYPVILAGFRALGGDVLLSVRIFNAVCYGLVVWLVLDAITRWHVAVALAMLTPVAGYTFFAIWSEPLFIVLVLLYLRWMPRRYLPLVIVTTLALLLRYSGVFLVVFGVLALARERRWRAAFAFPLLPLAAISGWMLRNWMLVGSPMGMRNPAKYTFAYNVEVGAQLLGTWFGLLIAFIVLEELIRWIVTWYLLSATRSSSSSPPA